MVDLYSPVTEKDRGGCLDLVKAISLCLGDLMGHTQLLLGDDVVGDLRRFHGVTRLVGFVGFHYVLIIALIFGLSITLLCI